MTAHSKIIINCDGGSRSNPGPAGIGVVVQDEAGAELELYKEFIGINTSNVAEYRALIKSLELARKYTSKEVLVYMDSELVIRQMNGEYKVKAVHLRELHLKVRKLEAQFEKVTYEWIPRAVGAQAKADFLVNEAMDEAMYRR
jgi:ribonuclease H / adenosylcobalamin/alpha-ribazole phosphatase